MQSFRKAKRNHLIILALLTLIPVTGILFSLGSFLLVRAHGGDQSLIHACKDGRGRVTIVGDSENCNANETAYEWVKNVIAGTGITITRNDSGATIALSNDNSDGWTSAGETWTYASAQSFTVSGNQTAKYKKGTRLKFTQTSVKYGFVISSSYSSPNTTVTIATNTDYTIANAAISGNYYSYQDNPQGYPYTFSFTPTINNGSVGNGTLTGYLSSSGNKAVVDIKWVFGATSSITGNVTFTGIPSSLTGASSAGVEIGNGFYYDDSNNDVVIGSCLIAAGELYPKINSQPFAQTYGTVHATKPFTWATNDTMQLHYEYQF